MWFAVPPHQGSPADETGTFLWQGWSVSGHQELRARGHQPAGSATTESGLTEGPKAISDMPDRIGVQLTSQVTRSGSVVSEHSESEDIPVIHPLWAGVGDDACWSLIGGFQWSIGLV
jgi:hypothetical protein